MSEAYGVPAVVRAARLLRHVGMGNDLSNQSVAAKALGINRTTLMRLVASLEAESLLERTGSGGFQLGSAFIELAAHRIFSADIVTVAGPIVARLAAELGLSAHLGQLDGRDVLYVLRHAPNVSLVSNVRVGSRLPAHATTMGRVLLAGKSRAEIEALYEDADLPAATAKTATTLPALLALLAADRARGHADSEGAFEAGIDSIAAPVRDASGAVIAAINVTGPEAGFRGTERRATIRAAVIGAAADASRRMGHRGQDIDRRAS